MKAINLGKHQKARVWIDDLPPIDYPSSRIVTHVIPAHKCRGTPIRRVAIELFVPLGPRSMYGLIGGQYEPDTGNSLIVEIAVSSADEDVYPDSLASQTDEVKVGLPCEYVRGIVSGIDVGCAEINGVNAGRLRIACAAHGLIGSSEAVFSRIAVALIKIVNVDQQDMSDSRIIELLSGR